ncbi:hypothetical protein K3727_04635 [Rhodobacteraceae bacterium M382]|nr:hypothetical protein K3727_04635 [Rhodobacteraceae bacterium M382]
MDYTKTSGPRMGKNKPRHAEHNAKGTRKNPFGKAPTKAELLERMKAAAQKDKDDA